jgi:hypothetical protein
MADVLFFVTLLPMTGLWLHAYHAHAHGFPLLVLGTLASFAHAVALTMQPPSWMCVLFGPAKSRLKSKGSA